MPIITDPDRTRAMLEELRGRQVALPCFCTENAWTTEAVLEATVAAGERYGLPRPPVSISFCSCYPARQHLKNYRVCGRHELGLESLLADLRTLTDTGGPYANCRVFPMLDHGQPEADRWLLEDRLDVFAMVMYDASHQPFEENLRSTADYVQRFGDRVVVEGAVAELKEAAAAGEAFQMTGPERAARFLSETGCDLIVPNVGTEHRAAEAGKARYHPEVARELREAVGHRMVLHGTSCMGEAGLGGVPFDGFVKVNVWTIIETTGARAVVDWVMQNLGNLLPRERLEELVEDGLCGPRVLSPEHVEEWFGGEVGPKLDYFPLSNLQRRWVGEVSEQLERYFEMFGYERLAEGGD
ncbi:MAG: class II fructose-bisphosphate aldolase [Planctomycetota bacterium]